MLLTIAMFFILLKMGGTRAVFPGCPNWTKALRQPPANRYSANHPSGIERMKEGSPTTDARRVHLPHATAKSQQRRCPSKLESNTYQQSKRSAPASIASRISNGCPSPDTKRGLSFGRCLIALSSSNCLSSSVSPHPNPQRAKPAPRTPSAAQLLAAMVCWYPQGLNP